MEAAPKPIPTKPLWFVHLLGLKIFNFGGWKISKFQDAKFKSGWGGNLDPEVSLGTGLWMYGRLYAVATGV